MIVSDKEIRKLAMNEKLIEPFNEKLLQTVSYDVSSSSIAIVYTSCPKIVDSRNTKQTELVRIVDITNGFPMRPGEYLLVKTREKFSIPTDITAYVYPNEEFIKIGLIVSSQQVSPAFSGYLYLGLHNVTQSIIDIYPNLAIARVTFEEIKGEVSKEKLHQNTEHRDKKTFDDLSEEEKGEINKIISKMLREKTVS